MTCKLQLDFSELLKAFKIYSLEANQYLKFRFSSNRLIRNRSDFVVLIEWWSSIALGIKEHHIRSPSVYFRRYYGVYKLLRSFSVKSFHLGNKLILSISPCSLCITYSSRTVTSNQIECDLTFGLTRATCGAHQTLILRCIEHFGAALIWATDKLVFVCFPFDSDAFEVDVVFIQQTAVSNRRENSVAQNRR